MGLWKWKKLYLFLRTAQEGKCVLLVNLGLYTTVFYPHSGLRRVFSLGRDFTQSQLILESGVSEIAKTHLKMLAVSHVHAVSKWSSSQGQPGSSTSKITGYGHLDSDLGFKERTPSKQLNSSIFLPWHLQIWNAKRAFAAIIRRMDDWWLSWSCNYNILTSFISLCQR